MTTTQVAEKSAPYFWLMHNGSPSGPFDVAQVHDKLVAGELLAITRVCRWHEQLAAASSSSRSWPGREAFLGFRAAGKSGTPNVRE